MTTYFFTKKRLTAVIIKSGCLCTLALTSFIFTNSYASQPTRVGWVEKAVIFPAGMTFHAKLDTGAKITSINAIDPEFFQRNGKRWSKFNLTNKDNQTITIEAEVIREAIIKRHYDNKQVRPVILLDICIGNVRKKKEANLVDRSNLNYQLLIGRNFLQGDLLIDSGATYISGDCSE